MRPRQDVQPMPWVSPPAQPAQSGPLPSIRVRLDSLELGVLEPDALRTYNQMIKDDMGAQAKAYLERRIAKVQIFRKRIPG